MMNGIADSFSVKTYAKINLNILRAKRGHQQQKSVSAK